MGGATASSVTVAGESGAVDDAKPSRADLLLEPVPAIVDNLAGHVGEVKGILQSHVCASRCETLEFE